MPTCVTASFLPSSCATDEGSDYMYPNPGNSVENFNMTKLILPKGDCGPKAAPGYGPPGGGSGSPMPSMSGCNP